MFHGRRACSLEESRANGPTLVLSTNVGAVVVVSGTKIKRGFPRVSRRCGGGEVAQQVSISFFRLCLCVRVSVYVTAILCFLSSLEPEASIFFSARTQRRAIVAVPVFLDFLSAYPSLLFFFWRAMVAVRCFAAMSRRSPSRRLQGTEYFPTRLKWRLRLCARFVCVSSL